MERSGVKTLMFNPFIPVLSLAMNNRDHRKIMDVDGHTVFTEALTFRMNTSTPWSCTAIGRIRACV